MNTPQFWGFFCFVFNSDIVVHLVCFKFMANIHEAAMNISYKSCVGICIHFFGLYTSRSGIVGHRVYKKILNSSVKFTFHLTMYESFRYYTPSLTLLSVSKFNYFGGCVSHCGFNMHFPDDW